jgi:hypothetical protein
MAERKEWIKGKKKNYENQLSDLVEGVINPLMDKQNRLRANMILNWNKIFSKDISKKIKFQDVKPYNQAINSFMLVVSCERKNFLELTHMKGQLIQNLSVYFGYKAVEKIKIVQEN